MNAQTQITAQTTLTAIRAKSPCSGGWTNILAHLGKTAADDDHLPLLTVLDSNGLDDALWVLQNTRCDERLSRHFGAWCAEQVLPIFEAERPDDKRPRLAIEAARDDNLGAAARAAAWAARAAARAAAGDAARAAAWAAAWAAGDAAWAARDAAWAARAAAGAAWAAAWAAGDAAWAARDAAWAARDAAWAARDAAGAAGAAARDAQYVHLRKMLTEGF